jgi:hypothetical protein
MSRLIENGNIPGLSYSSSEPSDEWKTDHSESESGSELDESEKDETSADDLEEDEDIVSQSVLDHYDDWYSNWSSSYNKVIGVTYLQQKDFKMICRIIQDQAGHICCLQAKLEEIKNLAEYVIL